MAQQWSTGACHIFAALGAGSTAPLYLGTTESQPQETRNPSYEPLMNDATGSQVPLDFAFEGISAQISIILTRWNENLYQTLIRLPSPSPAQQAATTNPIGAYTINDLGTLMSLEGRAITLWIVYTFGASLANKAAYTGALGLPPGHRYVQTIFWAPETEEQGARPMKRHLMFLAWPYLAPNTSPQGKFLTLYDFNMTGINAASIT